MPTGENPLRIAIKDFMLDDIFKDFFKNIFESVIKFVEDEAREVFVKTVLSVVDKEDLPPEAQNLIYSSLMSNKPAAIMAIMGAGFTIGASIAGAFLVPVANLISQQLNPVLTPMRLDIATTLKGMWRGLSVGGDIRNELVKQGMSKERIEVIEETNRPRIDEYNLVRFAYRFPTRIGEVKTELSKRGYSDDEIENLFNAIKQYPSPQDFVRFNLRDVFNPAIISRMGFDEDLTQRYLDEMAKLGFDQNYAELYHFAGWDVMSPFQAYQALHRLRVGKVNNPFTEQDLDFILKIADYPPPIRDWLKQLAYNTLTRVDIRRMYQLGIMSESDVLDAYLDDGYSPKHAEWLTRFAIQDAGDSSKDLSRETIEAAYNLGIINRQTAKQSLIDVGYDDSESDVLLSIIEVRQNNAKMKDEIEIIEFKYVEQEIDWPIASSELDKIGVPPDMKGDLRETWDIRIRKKIKRLSKAEIEDLYRNELFDINFVQGEIAKLGYTLDNAQMIVRLIDIEVTKQRTKELADKQAELERLDKANRASEYQKRKAVLDVAIAELKLEAAEIKLALNQDDNQQFSEDLMERLELIKVEIADLNVQKAEVRRDTL